MTRPTSWRLDLPCFARRLLMFGSVVALLDTTRAKLAGAVVRNEDELENSEIVLGIRDDVIVRNFGTFIVRRREGS